MYVYLARQEDTCIEAMERAGEREREREREKITPQG